MFTAITALLWAFVHSRLSTTYTHMSNWIAQFYLPPDRCDVSAITPAEAGTRLIEPWGMVNLSDFEPSVLRHHVNIMYQNTVVTREIWSADSCVPVLELKKKLLSIKENCKKSIKFSDHAWKT